MHRLHTFKLLYRVFVVHISCLLAVMFRHVTCAHILLQVLAVDCLHVTVEQVWVSPKYLAYFHMSGHNGLVH